MPEVALSDWLASRVGELWALGGFVMPPLTLMALVLWYAVGLRAQRIAEAKREARALEGAPAGEQRRRALGGVRLSLTAGHAVIATVVGVAPLLGLLGTVNGMIETFASLAGSELFARSGGIAGGVSEALFSTQMGLVVAIPGAIAQRLLKRRADAVEELIGAIESDEEGA